MPSGGRVENTLERLKKRYIKVLDNGCWEWTGALNKDGYGKVTYQTIEWRVHRLFYQLIKGYLPPGKDLHHKCIPYLRRCANPDHMELVSKGKHPDGIRGLNLAKTHCPQGHEYSPENTGIQNGSRYCRTCHRKSFRRWAAKNDRH